MLIRFQRATVVLQNSHEVSYIHGQLMGHFLTNRRNQYYYAGCVRMLSVLPVGVAHGDVQQPESQS